MRRIRYIRPVEQSNAFTYEMEDEKGKRFFTTTITKDELMNYMKSNTDAIQKTYIEELLEEMNTTMYY